MAKLLCDVCGGEYSASECLEDMVKNKQVESLCSFCSGEHDDRDPDQPEDYNDEDIDKELYYHEDR